MVRIKIAGVELAIKGGEDILRFLSSRELVLERGTNALHALVLAWLHEQRWKKFHLDCCIRFGPVKTQGDLVVWAAPEVTKEELKAVLDPDIEEFRSWARPSSREVLLVG